MLAKRIIACLDVADGRVVKGRQFLNLRDSGDPAELAERYSDEGADEVVFLDISATYEGRKTMAEVVAKTARKVFVPLSVGGGVRSIADAKVLLNSGADKICVNSAAIDRPEVLTELSEEFGSQATVLAIDAKKIGDDWRVFKVGGRCPTDRPVVQWARTGQDAGAGEILLTSMDSDGVMEGFETDLLTAVSAVTHVPIIASGGAGTIQHFLDLFQRTNVSAALAATVFHDGIVAIADLKAALAESGVVVRPT